MHRQPGPEPICLLGRKLNSSCRTLRCYNKTTMTTPGRTHIPWQTQPAQIQELISYIGFLEANVSYLQYHHEHCDTWVARPPLAGANSPSLPLDFVVNDESRASPDTPSPTAAPCTCVSLTTAQPSAKRVEGNPRWKQIADQITKGWDKSSSWTEKREAIGLDSVKQNNYALTAILGLKKDLPVHLARDEFPSSASRNCINAIDALVTSARQYALDSKASQRSSGHGSTEFFFLCRNSSPTTKSN